jgi:hypothetical protein
VPFPEEQQVKNSNPQNPEGGVEEEACQAAEPARIDAGIGPTHR